MGHSSIFEEFDGFGKYLTVFFLIFIEKLKIFKNTALLNFLGLNLLSLINTETDAKRDGIRLLHTRGFMVYS